MIFATTGTQLAFPRLMAALNGLAPDLGEEIIAQAGPDPAPYPALQIAATLTPAQYEDTVTRARLIVAHAGIGTILTARRHAKPLILVPRKAALGEHRNDHQWATAEQVSAMCKENSLNAFVLAEDWQIIEHDETFQKLRKDSEMSQAYIQR